MTNLRERVLDVFEQSKQTACPARALYERFKDIEKGRLDVCLNALVRDKALSLGAGSYTLLATVPTTTVEIIPTDIPSETRSSADVVCAECHVPQPRARFRLLNDGERSPICNACHGRSIKTGQRKAAEQRQESAASPLAPPTALEEADASLRPVPTMPAPGKSVSMVRDSSPPTSPTRPPVIADRVMENAQRVRQQAREAIAMLDQEAAAAAAKAQEAAIRRDVESDKHQQRIAEVDEFLRLYERFAEAAC